MEQLWNTCISGTHCNFVKDGIGLDRSTLWCIAAHVLYFCNAIWGCILHSVSFLANKTSKFIANHLKIHTHAAVRTNHEFQWYDDAIMKFAKYHLVTEERISTTSFKDSLIWSWPCVLLLFWCKGLIWISSRNCHAKPEYNLQIRNTDKCSQALTNGLQRFPSSPMLNTRVVTRYALTVRRN